ncbi:MAG: hypothetical protein CBHOC_4054 [uncultured Caballeronia sp.]|nr:MAG: hypothetical protein CBHOC_4054 [uncultured Caballeronia sp.]
MNSQCVPAICEGCFEHADAIAPITKTTRYGRCVEIAATPSKGQPTRADNRGINSHTLESIAALTETVAAIRHAKGLKNSHDLPEGSLERQLASDAFADDFLRALDAEPGIGAWWRI